MIELIGFDGCPNLPSFRRALTDAVGAEGFIEVRQPELEHDDPRRRFPSPSILVDGRDLFGAEPANGGCRVLPNGPPTAHMIRDRLTGKAK